MKKQQLNLLHKNNKEHGSINTTDKAKMLHIEISAEKINALLTQRIICAADIRCLDKNSKYCLKELCLSTCLYNTKPCPTASQLLGDLTDSSLPIKNYEHKTR